MCSGRAEISWHLHPGDVGKFDSERVVSVLRGTAGEEHASGLGFLSKVVGTKGEVALIMFVGLLARFPSLASTYNNIKVHIRVLAPCSPWADPWSAATHILFLNPSEENCLGMYNPRP